MKIGPIFIQFFLNKDISSNLETLAYTFHPGSPYHFEQNEKRIRITPTTCKPATAKLRFFRMCHRHKFTLFVILGICTSRAVTAPLPCVALYCSILRANLRRSIYQGGNLLESHRRAIKPRLYGVVRLQLD